MLMKDIDQNGGTDNVRYGDIFTDDQFTEPPYEKFDYLLANPPFGVDWKRQQKEIEREHVLNLNLPLIKNNRSGVLTALLDWWRRERDRLRGPVPRVRIEREIEQWTRPAGDLTPYCQVAVWWLQQKLAGMR